MNKRDTYFKEIQEIEHDLHTILKHTSFSYPKPTNSKKERKKFFKKFANDEKYNPQLEYHSREVDNHIIDQLIQLKNSISKSNDLYNIKRLIIEKIDERITTLQMFKTWGTIESSTYSLKCKGKPSKKIYNEALKYIKEFERETVSFKRLTVKRLGRELQKEVKRISGEHINVEFMELANKLSIDASTNIIRINPQERFTSLDLKRLLVHEIQTHYQRYYNATKLPFKILERGTAQYVATEEGLAVYMEHIHNVLSKAQLYIYAGRVVATYLCTKKSFYDIFIILRNLGFKDEDAYSITLRSKRNIKDTSQKGGYTRDYVYFQGFLEVSKHIEKNPQDFEKLFIGKIKLKDLRTLKKFFKDLEKGLI